MLDVRVSILCADVQRRAMFVARSSASQRESFFRSLDWDMMSAIIRTM